MKKRFSEEQIAFALRQSESGVPVSEIIESWRMDYNTVRPHSALGNVPPEEFARAVPRAPEAPPPPPWERPESTLLTLENSHG